MLGRRRRGGPRGIRRNVAVHATHALRSHACAGTRCISKNGCGKMRSCGPSTTPRTASLTTCGDPTRARPRHRHPRPRRRPRMPSWRQNSSPRSRPPRSAPTILKNRSMGARRQLPASATSRILRPKLLMPSRRQRRSWQQPHETALPRPSPRSPVPPRPRHPWPRRRPRPRPQPQPRPRRRPPRRPIRT